MHCTHSSSSVFTISVYTSFIDCSLPGYASNLTAEFFHEQGDGTERLVGVSRVNIWDMIAEGTPSHQIPEHFSFVVVDLAVVSPIHAPSVAAEDQVVGSLSTRFYPKVTYTKHMISTDKQAIPTLESLQRILECLSELEVVGKREHVSLIVFGHPSFTQSGATHTGIMTCRIWLDYTLNISMFIYERNSPRLLIVPKGTIYWMATVTL